MNATRNRSVAESGRAGRATSDHASPGAVPGIVQEPVHDSTDDELTLVIRGNEFDRRGKYLGRGGRRLETEFDRVLFERVWLGGGHGQAPFSDQADGGSATEYEIR